MSHYKLITQALLLLLAINFSNKSFAIDNNQTDRARVISPRNERFYKSNRIRQYVNFGGEYESDENNKQYVFSLGHFYRSSKLINEVDFLHQVDYVERSSQQNQLIKTSELYDFQISSKAIIKDGRDYLVFYNRSKYDDLSSYYYDVTTAVGVGRMFFDDRLEIDVGIGHSNVKEFDQKTSFVPSFRTEFDITKNIHFIQRGYAFFSDQAHDYQLRSRIQYPISQRLYLQLSYDIDKRRYSDKNKNIRINEVHRRAVLGFRYDLGGQY